MLLNNYFKVLLAAAFFLVLPMIVSAQTVYTTPPPPSFLTATVSNISVNLNWGTVSTATHYNVYRTTPPSTDYTQYVCSTSGSGSTNCTDTAVTSGMTYMYRVEACLEGNGCSGAWNGLYAYSSSVTVGSSNTCSGFTVTTNKTSYTIGEDLSWTWSCSSGVATSWAIELVKPDNSVWPYTNGTFGTGQSSYNGSFGTNNLLVGTHTLRACFEVGCPTVNASTTFAMTSSNGGGSLTQPALSVTTTGMTANLTWTDPTGNAETGFKIFRRFSGSAWSDTPIYYQPPNITTYTDAVTTAGNYEYKVQVYTSTDSMDSNTVAVSVGAGGGLTSPYLSFTTSSSQVYLTWTDTNTNENGFRVFRKLSTASWSDTPLATLSSNTSSYTDSITTAGTYNYKIQVYTSTASLDSNSVAATISSGGGGGGGGGSIPQPPSTLTATASGTSVNLAWSSSSGATHYNLSRATSTVGPWTSVCTNAITALACTDTAVPTGTYLYRVEACTSGYGCSGTNNQWTYSPMVTISGTSGSCTGLNLTLDKTYYSIGENVNYTWSCTPGGTATFVAVQLVKPDASVITYNTYSGAGQSSMSLGFSTSNLYTGGYTLRACFTSTCTPVTVSAPFTISTTTVNVPPAPGMPVGLSTALQGQNIYFTTTLYSSTSEQLQAIFDWGDNTSFGFSSPVGATSTGTVSPPVYHTYNTVGTYSVRAKAKNSAGLESGWSGSFTITISGGTGNIPAAPTNLRLESSSATGIYIKWNDNSNNEDKFNLERKLTTVTDWSGGLNVQLQGANIVSYNDTTVTSGTTYDYRVQACLSGTGCSTYSILSGVTAGTTPPVQTYQAVTVKTLSGAIVPSGLVAFVKDGISVSANFNNSSSTTIYLFPGTYEMQPSFPAVNNSEVQLTGTGVTNRQITITSSTSPIVYVFLPIRQPVSVKVSNSAGQPIVGARAEAGVAGSTAYAAADTDGSGVAWLQLAAGSYQVLVAKSGYLAKSSSVEVGTAGAEVTIVLESLSVNVSGKVTAGSSPKSGAVVRAVHTIDGSIVIVSTNDDGYYSIALKAGSWHFYVSADGYYEGDGGMITLSNNSQTKELSLGALKQLISSSANIVPTVSVTVTAAELGVTVGLPANALGGGSLATVTIKESSHTFATPVATPLPGSVRDVTANSGGTAVTSLNSAASIELNYNDGDLTSLGVIGSDTNNLKLAYWDTERNDWQVMESVVDTSNKKVRAATNHFTLFAIVLPFLAQPASAQSTTPTEPETSTTTSTTSTDSRVAQFAAIVAEGTKVYVSCSECLASSVSLSRNLSLEQKYDTDIVKRVVGTETITTGARSTIVNFVTYGTASTIALGAGERGGVVASFKSAYGHLPNSEYEWQEVIKIANGRWPGTLLQEREQAMKATFKKIYLREPVVTQANDSAALSIMAYGLRSAKRNLASEAASINSFKAIYGRGPASATDWDAVRAISYSGAKR